ncbi:hypothetical protein Pmani_024052 [Petrolisthes manimaculis]|uniref:Uncharacterized protein n=1 Tax=Petrolisthes manimaculis TaxID=1843537 RepID=A0AAE1P8L0_9EUCA|nr:hypothetical protein Pmani_024052 [Petrolisthes manimaculis]
MERGYGARGYPGIYYPEGRPGRYLARYIITHHNPKVLRPPPCWSPLDPRHMRQDMTLKRPKQMWKEKVGRFS